MADDILDELLNDVDSTSQDEGLLEPLKEEIEYIEDYAVRDFVKSVLLKAPMAFWLGPASASGKWHPPDERGVAGNVLHTKRVVRVAKLLGESQERSQYHLDILIAAAILHDLLKNIQWADGTMHNDRMHPYTVDNFVEWVRAEDKKYSSESSNSSLQIDEAMLSEILRLVRCHMGIYSPIPETIPVTQMDWLLHFADNIAAHLHNIIDGENIVESRWNANPDDRPGD